MTTEEAKLLLAVSRETDPDPDDRELAAALAMAAADPELHDWHRREQACLAALDAKLGTAAPPAGLREKLLAGHPYPAASRPRWYRRPAVPGAAAILLLSLLGASAWLKRPFTSGGTTLAAYEQDMGTYLDRFFLLDYESAKIPDVTAWLRTNRGVEDFVIPAALADHPSLGWEVIPWHGRVSYLICFDVEGVLYHLFLLPGGADLGVAPGDRTGYPPDPKWASTSWKEGNDLYFCCSLGKQDEFRRVLGRPIRMRPAGA